MTDNTQELEQKIFHLTAITGQKFMKTKVLEDWTLAKDIMPIVLDWHNKQVEEVKRTERLKGVRDGYNYALTDVDLATDLNNAYRRVSDGHKKAMERVND